MVTNFTANQIGDFMFAKLVDPYEDITKVTGWNVTVGVSTPNTVGLLSMSLGGFNITGIDTNFCINKDTIDINVWNLPVADAGEDLWICPGGSLTLSAIGGITYNWFPDSTLSSSVGTPTASPFDDETYVVEVIDINNCINYDTVIIDISPSAIANAGDDIDTCANVPDIPCSAHASTQQCKL